MWHNKENSDDGDKDWDQQGSHVTRRAQHRGLKSSPSFRLRTWCQSFLKQTRAATSSVQFNISLSIKYLRSRFCVRDTQLGIV